MRFEFDPWVTRDGGALSNGTADSAGCGSHRLEARTGRKQMILLAFGRGTTKATCLRPVEYENLITALKYLVGCVLRAGKSPRSYCVVVHADSQLLVGQLTQAWQSEKSVVELLLGK